LKLRLAAALPGLSLAAPASGAPAQEPAPRVVPTPEAQVSVPAGVTILVKSVTVGPDATVRTHLLRLKVAAARMSTRGLGEARPVAPNAQADGSDDPAGRQRNRRVEFLIGEAGR